MFLQVLIMHKLNWNLFPSLSFRRKKYYVFFPQCHESVCSKCLAKQRSYQRPHGNHQLNSKSDFVCEQFRCFGTMPSIWYWRRGYLREQTALRVKWLQCPFEVLITLNYWEMSGSFLMMLTSLLSACGAEASSVVLVLQKNCKVTPVLKAVTHYWCSRVGHLFLSRCLFGFGKQVASARYLLQTDAHNTHVHTKWREGKPLIIPALVKVFFKD